MGARTSVGLETDMDQLLAQMFGVSEAGDGQVDQPRPLRRRSASWWRSGLAEMVELKTLTAVSLNGAPKARKRTAAAIGQ